MALDERLAGVINHVRTLVMVILMMVMIMMLLMMVMVMMSRTSVIEHHRQPWSVGKVDQGLICQNSDRVVPRVPFNFSSIAQHCTDLSQHCDAATGQILAALPPSTSQLSW